MARVRFDDNTIIDFDGDPTDEDIEEAYSSVTTQEPPARGLPEEVRPKGIDIKVGDLLTPVSIAARINPESTLQVAAGVAENLPTGHVQRALESVEDNPLFGGLSRIAQRAMLPVEFTRSIRKAAGEEVGIERKIGQTIGDLGSLAITSAFTAPIAGTVATSRIFSMLPRFQSVARFAGARMAQSGVTFNIFETIRT